MFCAAVFYARFVYLNEDEFSVERKRSVFKQLNTFWEKNRKDKSQFPRTDMFYVMSARMLLYSGHYFWKFEEDWETAVLQLERGLKGLDKIKHVACLTKQDLQLQIRNMKETIKERDVPRVKKFQRISRVNQTDDATTAKDAQKKSPLRPHPSLFEMIKKAPVASSNFQIHDDRNEAAPAITPNVKKLSRNRLKKTEDFPMRTPSQRIKPSETASVPKVIVRPKRNIKPTLVIDLSSESESSTETKSTPRIDYGKEISEEYTEKRNTRKAGSQSKGTTNGKK